MKILVCVKQVPEHMAAVTVNAAGNRAEIADSMKYRINRFDEYAVEAAVAIKETYPGTAVDVVTVGPESVETVIRRAMGMGADHGMIVSMDKNVELTPGRVSGIIAKAARREGYDLIFTGIMSEDEMNAQTGQMIAARLGIPSASGIIEISGIEPGGGVRTVREREGGIRERIFISTPAVLTIQAGINRPRYPALSAILRANAKEVDIISGRIPETAGEGHDRATVWMAPSEKIRQGKVIEGTPSEKAEQLMTLLNERNVLI